MTTLTKVLAVIGGLTLLLILCGVGGHYAVTAQLPPAMASQPAPIAQPAVQEQRFQEPIVIKYVSEPAPTPQVIIVERPAKPAPAAKVKYIYGQTEEAIDRLATHRLTAAEVRSMGPDQATYLRNGLYAKYGFHFKTAAIQAKFENKPWYVARFRTDEQTFSEMSRIEKNNVLMLRTYGQ